MLKRCKKVVKKCHFRVISVEKKISVTVILMIIKYLQNVTLFRHFQTTTYKNRLFHYTINTFYIFFVETVENNII